MIKMKRGIWASSSVFRGIATWLISGDSGKLFGSLSGTRFKKIATQIFGTSDVNNVIRVSSATATPNTALNLLQWTTVDPNIGAAQIFSIAYGDGIWAIGGEYGRIRISTNGTNFIPVDSLFLATRSVGALRYGGGHWLAGGQGGTLRRSTDAITWVTSNPLTVSWVNDFVYANGNWILTADGGNMRRSTDGITWTTVNQGSSIGTYGITYKNNLWAVYGSSGYLATSTDSINWTTRNSTFGATTIKEIDYGNGVWIAVGGSGQMRASTDAISWVTRTSTFNTVGIESVKFVNNMWAASGYQGQLRVSTDSINWTTRVSSFGSSFIYAMEYSNGLWMMGGSGATLRKSDQVYDYAGSAVTLAIADDGKVALSTDNLSWSTVNVPVSSNNNIVVNGGISNPLSFQWGLAQRPTLIRTEKILYEPVSKNFVLAASQQSAVAVSSDGVFWRLPTLTQPAFDIYGIDYGQSIYTIGGTSGRIQTSTNLISWVSVFSTFGSSSIRSIAYNNGTWIAAGVSGQMRTSTNALSWTTVNSTFGATTIRSVSYGNGKWVATGYSGQIRSSSDNGVTWTTIDLGVTSTLFSSKYLNGSWLVGYPVGTTGIVRISTDAVTWTTQVSASSSSNIYDFAYGDNKYIMVGTNSRVSISTDLVNWTLSTVREYSTTDAFTTTSAQLQTVAYGNGMWVIGSNSGNRVYYSDGFYNTKSWFIGG